jgi:hypothetical protein
MNDIAGIAFAFVLALASALALLVSRRARPFARDYLRFATALYAALAVVDLVAAIEGQIWSTQLAGTVALMVAALAPMALALTVAGVFGAPPKAAVAASLLVLACLAGFAAAITGEAFIALAPLAACVCAMLALAARRWRAQTQAPLQVCISAIALLAAAAAISTGNQGSTAFALFSAAALLGASLAATKPLHRTVEENVQRLDLRVGRQS